MTVEKHPCPARALGWLLLSLWFGAVGGRGEETERIGALPLQLVGWTVTPHEAPADIRLAGEPRPCEGARVELFLRHADPVGGTNAFACNAVRFDNEVPQKLVQTGAWAWHDTPGVWSEEETQLAPGRLVVWRFNSKQARWGVGESFPITVVDWQRIARAELQVPLERQGVWFSSIVFTSHDGNASPDRLTFHIANHSASAVQFLGARLFLPENPTQPRTLLPEPLLADVERHPADGWIPRDDKGCFQARTRRLPLTYTAVQALLADDQGQRFALWAYVRIKRQTFDIGGGWVQDSNTEFNTLTHEPFLKTLQRMHVNTANLVSVPGYTDQTGPSGLYTRYPLKRLGRFDPIAQYDRDALLPFIHAADVLNEPQFAAGTARFPQAVWQALQPYTKTRLPTCLTLADISSWPDFAGLSDLSQLEAYRVVAPANDEWMAYDRWGEKRVPWGAPLETLGSLCRNLREMNRPNPIGAWSQGPHHGWGELGGRKRACPTPEEIRLQAYYALSSRVVSLHWYNLSLRALVQFRDTIDEITRIGREIGVLSNFFIEGDAYGHQQVEREGKPDWELASIVSPAGAVLFALDLDYEPDRGDRVFAFKRRRDCRFTFQLPAYLRQPADVFRIDADGVYDAKYTVGPTGVTIEDRQNKVAVYVVAPTRELRAELERNRQNLLAGEQALDFDPARRGRDFDQLKAALEPRP